MGEKKSKRDETPEERKERKRLKKEKKETYSYQESTELKNLSTSTIQEYLDKHSIHDSSLFRPIIDFKHIQFPNVIHQVILDLKFTAPTPIQAATWPSLLSGRDLIGIAATGSGKTYSFGIPALIHILNKNIVPSTKPVSVASPQVLILAPTRELALQTVSTLQVFCNAVKSNIVCLYGGAPKHEQKRSLLENGGAQIVVATPGRLMDLLGLGFSNNEDSNPCMNLENVGYFILDEADRMLDMGFEKDIQKIANGITGTKQTVMFRYL